MSNTIEKYFSIKLHVNRLRIISLFLFIIIHTVVAQNLPFIVKTNLFDQSKPEDLGLSKLYGAETITVFMPSDSTDHFSNGAVLTAFKGHFYCQWQSSATDEDSPDTWVAFSRSIDSKHWTVPKAISPRRNDGYFSSGGWWIAGDSLVAYLNFWPSNISPKGGYTYYTKSSDGLTWSSLRPVLMENGDTLKGIFEQDPHSLQDGRIINAAHFQPGLVTSPIYTDDPSGTIGWIRASFKNLSIENNTSREMEPSWYLRNDGEVVMIFRDQSRTYKKLASVSTDHGVTWSKAEITDMPDSRSKQCSGNLPNGTAFMIGNPVNNKTRIPLAISLSRERREFNKAFLLRAGGSDLQPQRYKGKSKTIGYSYPKSYLYAGYLYISYSTNKEDVELTRIPLKSLE